MRYRWPQGLAADKTLERPNDWAGTGVSTDSDVRTGARIMAASALLYGSVQARTAPSPSPSPSAPTPPPFCSAGAVKSGPGAAHQVVPW